MGVLETKKVIQPPKRRRMTKARRQLQLILKAVVTVALVIALGSVVYVVGFAKYETIDLSELTKAELNGYNGHGTLKTTTEIVTGYETFFETVHVNILDSEKAVNGMLSNGDKIEIEYTYDKKVAKSLGLKIKAKDEYVNVKDLPDATVVSCDELFAGVDIAYEGIAPLVTISLVNNTSNEVLKTVEFKVKNQKEFYDNGDVVVVEAVFDNALMAANAYEIKPGANGFTKEFTISGCDRYLTDYTELPDDILQQMKEHGATLFGQNSGDANEFGLRIFSDAGLMYTTENTKYTFRFTGTRYISSYFANVEPEHIGEVGTHVNDVKVVYDTGVSQSDGQSVTAEAVVIYRNILKKADGTIVVNFDEGEIISVSRRDSQIKELVRGTEDDQYSSTKLEQD
ncbi:MAG: hypothetical protein KBS96_02750 [Lachnospiraceae bacterium]|nr:hypothetical protein [Candidatus Colinaster scatohippi]